MTFSKMSTEKDKQCYQALKKLFTQYNVPQSVQSAMNNTGSAFTKSFIERGLAKLLDEKYIVYLQIGKSGKLYVRDQSQLKVLSQDEINQISSETNNIQKEIGETQQQIQELQGQLQDFQSTLTQEEIQQQLQQEQAKNQQLIQQLKEFDGVQIQDKQFYENQLKQLKNVFQQHKELYDNLTDLIDKISEGAEIDIKDLYEQVGLEPMNKPIKPQVLKKDD